MRKRNLFILLCIILSITTIVWIVQIVNGYVPIVDQWTRELALTYPETSIYTFASFVTNFGSRHFLIPFVIIAGVILWILYKHWLPTVIYVVGTLFTYELNGFIKDIVQRERPSIVVEVNAVGNSFPSGHAMISMVCYGLLGYFLAKKVKSKNLSFVIQVVFSFIIFLIGTSRYILNVHFMSDIVAGFVIGFIFLLAFIYLFEWLYQKS